MLEFPPSFYVHIAISVCTSRSGLPYLYKSVLALLYRTLHLVIPLISSVFPLSSRHPNLPESSPDIRCKVQQLLVNPQPLCSSPCHLVTLPLLRYSLPAFSRLLIFGSLPCLYLALKGLSLSPRHFWSFPRITRSRVLTHPVLRFDASSLAF